MPLELWISLLEVEPLPESDYKNTGNAFVNGITLSDSSEGAVANYKGALEKLGWKLLSSENTEEFYKRVATFEVAFDLKTLASIARETGKTQFGTFHTW